MEYITRKDTEKAKLHFNKYILDNYQISIGYDTGFVEGRQYGRGYGGGQAYKEINRN